MSGLVAPGSVAAARQASMRARRVVIPSWLPTQAIADGRPAAALMARTSGSAARTVGVGQGVRKGSQKGASAARPAPAFSPLPASSSPSGYSPPSPYGPAAYSPAAPDFRAAGPSFSDLSPAGPGSSPAEGHDAQRLSMLAQLGQLHRQGVLTDAEFAAQKAQILSD
jgi:Short C-terminal domain